MKARAMLTQGLQNRAKPKPSNSDIVGGTSVDLSNSSHEEQRLSVPQNDELEPLPIEMSTGDPTNSPEAANFEMDKHPVIGTEIPVIDKAVVEEVSLGKTHNEMPTSSSSKDVEAPKNEDDARMVG